MEEALQAGNLGVYLEGVLISSLILMDDIILIASTPEMLQKMLDTIDRVAMRWHLTFNRSKSKVMVINAPPNVQRETVDTRSPHSR